MDVGHAHFEKKEFRAALDAYQGADALVHVPTTRLGVGRALLELGRWLEARDVLLQVAAAAVGPSDPPAFQRAKDTAGELADELDQRLPSIQARVVDAPADTPVRVTIDGTKLPNAAAQLPRRVDPGAHTVEANAEGYAPFRQQVTVSERQALVVPVAMKSSNDGGRAPSVGPLGIPWVTWSWGSVGVGATSLLIGGITGGVAGDMPAKVRDMMGRSDKMEKRIDPRCCSASMQGPCHVLMHSSRWMGLQTSCTVRTVHEPNQGQQCRVCSVQKVGRGPGGEAVGGIGAFAYPMQAQGGIGPANGCGFIPCKA
jgi:hypothetical protein